MIINIFLNPPNDFIHSFKKGNLKYLFGYIFIEEKKEENLHNNVKVENNPEKPRQYIGKFDLGIQNHRRL